MNAQELDNELQATQQPHIGQWVDYFPIPSERNAALVVEVFPTDTSERPKVNLQVFTPKGKTTFKNEIQAVDLTNDPDTDDDAKICNIANTWAFQGEVAVQQKADHDNSQELGSNSNTWVNKSLNLQRSDYAS